MLKLSVVIPAFNEAQRLPQFLSKLVPTLQVILPGQFEIIVVDDGSRDQTPDLARTLIHGVGRVVIQKQNFGKGAAVKVGLEAALGEYTCITDADGSADLASFAESLKILERSHSPGLIGVRYGHQSDQGIVLSMKRAALGSAFAAATRIILGLRYADTQCGFKMFRTAPAKLLFKACQMQRYGLDFEVLYVASLYGIKFEEYRIKWQEKAGSKVNVFTDGLKMVYELFEIRGVHRRQPDLDAQLRECLGDKTELLRLIQAGPVSKDLRKTDQLDHAQQEEYKRIGTP